jgi:hypothetical protein
MTPSTHSAKTPLFENVDPLQIPSPAQEYTISAHPKKKKRKKKKERKKRAEEKTPLLPALAKSQQLATQQQAIYRQSCAGG